MRRQLGILQGSNLCNMYSTCVLMGIGPFCCNYLILLIVFHYANVPKISLSSTFMPCDGSASLIFSLRFQMPWKYFHFKLSFFIRLTFTSWKEYGWSLNLEILRTNWMSVWIEYTKDPLQKVLMGLINLGWKCCC